ncbi:hypothetical protein AGMMS50276_11390 [Synergistales bacterium]|nr:hypothetical protein AGMMS50276_11390 [Synergistales bacterium]
MLLAPVLFMFFSTMAEAREAQIVVGFQYSDARDFSEGLAAVKSADLWGYIDATGKETILPAWKAPEVGQFSEGFAFVGNSFIDTIGAAAFDGHTFDRARPFSDGLAAVQSGGQWGFIDTAGRFAILPIYEDAGSFSDGLAPVKRGGLWGFIDRAGRLLITPRYTRAGIFSADGITSSRAPESQSRAAVEYDGKIGYIDKTGRFAVLPKYDEGEEFHNALAPVRGSRSRGDWGYIDTAGREVIPRQFHGAGMFSEGLAPVATDARWGYIDTRGKIVLEPFYDYARPFSEGLAAVERDGKWGYIMIK